MGTKKKNRPKALESLAMKKMRMIKRREIIRAIRTWFDEREFLEISTPGLMPHPSGEPHIHPIDLELSNLEGKKYTAYLSISPEIFHKKLLAAGYERIYEIRSCYRDREHFRSPHHNPEFTMLEWYRLGADYNVVMRDVSSLIDDLTHQISGSPQLNYLDCSLTMDAWRKTSVEEAFRRWAHIDLNDLDDWERLVALYRERGMGEVSSPDDAFCGIFANDIEKHLGRKGPEILFDYPSFQSGMARLKEKDPRYAERFEVFIGGLEIANGYSELCDASEQKERLHQFHRWHRGQTGKNYAVDPDFIQSLEHIPSAAGVAMGVDRLTMLLTNAAHISEVILFPAEQIFQ